jgi:predicted transport protein
MKFKNGNDIHYEFNNIEPIEDEIESEISANEQDENSNLDKHLQNKPQQILDLYNGIKSIVLEYIPDSEEHSKKYYLAFTQDGHNLLEIWVLKKKIQVFFRVPYEKMNKSTKLLLIKTPASYRWGDTCYVDLVDAEQLSDFKILFENASEIFSKKYN